MRPEFGKDSHHQCDVLSDEEMGRLREVFLRYPAIRAVYLFGSVAEGRALADSDLDLAVVPRDSSLREKRLDILTDLARGGFCDVDLVFLDVQDIVLRYEAVRQNQVIYQTGDFDRGEMYSRVIREYLDFEPYLRIQREAYKRRLLDGQNGSNSEETQ
jgi:uncharacterized protein